MDRSAKRKALAPPTPAAESRAPKRQRSPHQDPFYIPKTRETRESATEVGLRFIAQLKAARDKNGRLISTNFLTLPDKKQIPQYYEQTLLPISIETLEAKIARSEYTQLAQLESDVKRMVSNAKQFNETSSEIYLDAERIRKMTSNFMVKHNPAYENKDYVAFPTPLPEQAAAPPSPVPVIAPTPTISSALRRSASSAALNSTKSKDAERDGSFGGMTLQDAQDQIINEIIKLKDDDSEIEKFSPFINLPSRAITSYYEVIKQPLSLKGLLKRVHGVHGRHEVTGVTDFKTWDVFEVEMSRIWDNARIYNEDGSDIYDLSLELEMFFKDRLAKAKAEVDTPALPTLKLNLAAKPNPIKLRLGSNKASPTPQASQQSGTPNTTGVSVDHGALRRQKDLVDAGMNGAKPVQSVPASLSLKPLPIVSTKPSLARTSSGSGKSPPTVPNGIKYEGGGSQTPAQTPAIGIQGSPSAVSASRTMPPLMTSTMLPPQSMIPTLNGTISSLPTSQAHVPYHTPSTGLDSKWRLEGKDASSALLQTLKITTPPDPTFTNPLNVSLPAHPSLAHQSVTLSLPPTHTTLRLEPTLSPSLTNPLTSTTALPGPGRPYKLFVTANGQRIQSNFLPSMGQAAMLQYDVKLLQGMNRIEIECVSTAIGGGGKRGGELELERVGIFVNLMRGV